MEIGNWFNGFEKGLERLSPEQRSAFLLECGRNCVNGGTLSVYQQLYERAQGDMDTFFHMVNELPGVRGGVVEKGRVYRLVFLECTCKLCKKGYVTIPLLCECSRQSVIYSLQCLWCSTILIAFAQHLVIDAFGQSFYTILLGFRLQPILVSLYVFSLCHIICRFPQSPCVSFPSARQRHNRWESIRQALRYPRWRRAACTSRHRSCKPSRWRDLAP